MAASSRWLRFCAAPLIGAVLTALVSTDRSRAEGGPEASSRPKPPRHPVCIIHTDRLYGALRPASTQPDRFPGLPAVAALLARAKAQPGCEGNTLVVDAGSSLFGSIETMANPSAMLGIMPSLGYRAMVLGNRDFDLTWEKLRDTYERVTTDLGGPPLLLLGANLTSSSERSLDGFRMGIDHRHHQVEHVGGVSVALIGWVDPEMPRQVAQTARASIEVGALPGADTGSVRKDCGCQWRTQPAVSVDLGKLITAARVEADLVVVVAGMRDAHTRDDLRMLVEADRTGSTAVIAQSAEAEPGAVTRTPGDWCVHNPYEKRSVGVLRFEPAGPGEWARRWSSLEVGDPTSQRESPKVERARVAAAEAVRLAGRRGVLERLTVIGSSKIEAKRVLPEATKEVTRWPPKGGRSPSAQNLVMALLSSAVDQRAPGCVVALNSNAVRGSVAVGVLTRSDLFDLVPFRDEVRQVERTWRQVYRSIERGLETRAERFDANPLIFAGDPHYGFREPIEWKDENRGDRVLGLEFNGRRLDGAALDTKVNLCSSRFLFDGGDCFTDLCSKESRDVATELRDELGRALAHHSPLKWPLGDLESLEPLAAPTYGWLERGNPCPSRFVREATLPLGAWVSHWAATLASEFEGPRAPTSTEALRTNMNVGPAFVRTWGKTLPAGFPRKGCRFEPRQDGLHAICARRDGAHAWTLGQFVLPIPDGWTKADPYVDLEVLTDRGQVVVSTAQTLDGTLVAEQWRRSEGKTVPKGWDQSWSGTEVVQCARVELPGGLRVVVRAATYGNAKAAGVAAIGPAQTQRPSRSTWPWWVLGAVLAGVGGVGFVVMRNRRRDALARSGFTPIEPNPFVSGNPIKSPEMFFGRREELSRLLEVVAGRGQGRVAVVHAGRRAGKTSLLYQLRGRASERNCVAVLVELHGVMPKVQSDADLLEEIARAIYEALGKPWETSPFCRGSVQGVAEPEDDKVRRGLAYRSFDAAIDDARTELAGRSLALLFDEYEALDRALHDGVVTPEFIGYAKAWIDGGLDRGRSGGGAAAGSLSVVLTGSLTLRQDVDAEGYHWAPLAGAATNVSVRFLAPEETHALITTPLAGRVEFVPEVIERIVLLTGGEPFFTQYLCRELVFLLNSRFKTRRVTAKHLDAVVDFVLKSPHGHLLETWRAMTRDQRLALVSLAAALEADKSWATVKDLHAVRSRTGVQLGEEELSHATSELFQLHEFLVRHPQDAKRMRFRIGLFRLWVRRSCPTAADVLEL